MRACLDGVVLAVGGDEPARPQLPHHLDRLLEHLQPHVGARPGVAEDVLVERLAGADAEDEPPLVQHGAGRRGLRDDRRVDPHGRAGDRRRHRQRRRPGSARRSPTRRTGSAPARRSTDGSGRRSTARRTGLLGQPGLLDQLGGRVLLAGQEVTDSHAVTDTHPNGIDATLATKSRTIRFHSPGRRSMASPSPGTRVNAAPVLAAYRADMTGSVIRSWAPCARTTFPGDCGEVGSFGSIHGASAHTPAPRDGADRAVTAADDLVPDPQDGQADLGGKAAPHQARLRRLCRADQRVLPFT